MIIADAPIRKNFIKEIVQTCKLYGIANVGITNFSPNSFSFVYWLNTSKIFVPHLEADITDKCNLHCAGCYHYANFSVAEDFYPLENFRRDISRIAQTCDVVEFYLLGGEPLLLKNVDDYIKILRQCLPKSDLRILTNGLLIPSLLQKILNAIRENNFSMDITLYPPTVKIVDKIKFVLDANKVSYHFSEPVEEFLSRMTLNGEHDPLKTRCICSSDICRTVRNGKIYKCPIDAFSCKFAERFGIEGFPQSVGVDIYAPNFSSMFEMLDGNVELCYWCAEKHRKIPWQPTNNPRLEDWLADPDELKNFL